MQDLSPKQPRQLPAIERALVGLWLAEESLSQFLKECQELEARLDTEDLQEEECQRIASLIGFDEEDAFCWRYQLVQMVAMAESFLLPRRIQNARQAKKAVLAHLLHPR
jgi:hypothetical protein